MRMEGEGNACMEQQRTCTHFVADSGGLLELDALDGFVVAVVHVFGIGRQCPLACRRNALVVAGSHNVDLLTMLDARNPRVVGDPNDLPWHTSWPPMRPSCSTSQ